MLLISDSKTIVNHTKFIINGWDKPCPGRQGYWQQKKLRLARSLVFWSRLHGCSNQFYHGLMILMTGRFGGAPILRKPPCVVFCLFLNPWANPTLPLPNTTNLLDEIWISHGRVAILPGLNPSNLHFLFAKPHVFIVTSPGSRTFAAEAQRWSAAVSVGNPVSTSEIGRITWENQRKLWFWFSKSQPAKPGLWHKVILVPFWIHKWPVFFGPRLY